MVLSTSTPVPPEVVDRSCAATDGVVDARAIELD